MSPRIYGGSRKDSNYDRLGVSTSIEYVLSIEVVINEEWIVLGLEKHALDVEAGKASECCWYGIRLLVCWLVSR